MEKILADLFELQDKEYRDFQMALIPNCDKEKAIGIRTPALRNYAKKIKNTKDAEVFMEELPHQYFDENQLHAFLVAETKEYEECIEKVEEFLPYVDNWATCDQMNPKCFKRLKDKSKLLNKAKEWMGAKHPYTIRFGIKVLMDHFLDEAFQPEYLELVAQIHSEEYYVRMMQAWYFATALAKQYEDTLPYLQENRLDAWVHKKTIQKAKESFRISDEEKKILIKICGNQ